MFKEAKGEINVFLNSGPVKSDRWAFLNEWANRFYQESKTLRNSGDMAQAGQNAEIALGEAFDVRAFHDELLGGGALPLDILQQRMDAWLQGQLQ